MKISSITGLRGVAALLVVYGHSVDWFALPFPAPFSGGIGVAIFFCLSGFLMAYLYLGRSFSSSAVADYAIARISRIAPAYLSIVLVSLIVYTCIDPDFVYPISGHNLLRHVLFSGNVSVFWSITPEVEFYFLFVVVWGAAYRFRSRSTMTGLVFVALVAILLIAYRNIFPGTFVGSKLHYFLFGAIAGTIRANVNTDSMSSKAVNGLHAVVLGGVVLMTFTILKGHGAMVIPFEDDRAFYGSLMTAVVGAFLVFCLSFPSRIANTLLGNRLMTMCGECSFSVYLLHMPTIYYFKKFLSQPLNLIWLVPFVVCILAVSWMNYRLVELPGARLIRFLGQACKRGLPLAVTS